MSIDSLPEADQTGQASVSAMTPAVRTYLANGVQQVNDTIAGAKRHLDELGTRRVQLDAQKAAAELELDQETDAAREHLAALEASRAQLLALLGNAEGSENELPTQVCFCGRIAVLDPVRGPVHVGDTTHLPAMEKCTMPPLGSLFTPGRAGGEGPVA
ncbi:hypothetical protein [Nonomuraea wenchangensis]|uniref:Uncharacterized protein n=1 Tax=Nonomuraea wenchangensis TaxID=568860 RepID=A0A1I0LW50_9ACTN|nr:hypothetical protein [Nonomuraea wenchangensis]SEU46391.1 hypothetical protein SAMN05421811_12721 [Nonomuraea wenchangensis]